jgi:hypothetical protein
MFGRLAQLLGGQAMPAQEWRKFYDQDHNPEYNPNGVEVWKLDPQGVPMDRILELYKQKMMELDPDGSRWRGSNPPPLFGSPSFRLRRPPSPPMMGPMA